MHGIANTAIGATAGGSNPSLLPAAGHEPNPSGASSVGSPIAGASGTTLGSGGASPRDIGVVFTYQALADRFWNSPNGYQDQSNGGSLVVPDYPADQTLFGGHTPGMASPYDAAVPPAPNAGAGHLDSTTFAILRDSTATVPVRAIATLPSSAPSAIRRTRQGPTAPHSRTARYPLTASARQASPPPATNSGARRSPRRKPRTSR